MLSKLLGSELTWEIETSATSSIPGALPFWRQNESRTVRDYMSTSRFQDFHSSESRPTAEQEKT
jgi:hypothetical protein